MSKVVLDASALLAFLFDEPGAAAVAEALATGACMSSVNFAEVLSKLVDRGVAVGQTLHDFAMHGLLDALEVVSFDRTAAQEAAEPRQSTVEIGLSIWPPANRRAGPLSGSPGMAVDALGTPPVIAMALLGQW